LRALLADPQAELYGVEIGEAAGLPSGTVHPILARLEGLRWVQSRWEDIDPKGAGRPARRYYRLTAAGAQAAGHPGAAGRAPSPLPAGVPRRAVRAEPRPAAALRVRGAEPILGPARRHQHTNRSPRRRHGNRVSAPAATALLQADTALLGGPQQ